MKREGGGRRDGLVVAYVGGGSRGWAWRLMADLAVEPRLSGTVRLYDIEGPAAETNAAIGNRLTSREDVAGKWRYEASPTLRAALRGADFVIASILPGSFDDMASDVHAPEELGIWQSVGDTTGPGGVLRALRTIPQYVEIAQAVRDECPEAWVVNYTNPMALCVRTLYEAFPGVKAFGCCHEVFGTRRLLAKVAELELGMAGASMPEVEVNVLGTNHFTWIDAASCRGADLLPAYARFVDAHHEAGFEGMEGRTWNASWFSSGERVKFDLYRRFGRVAAAGDRHLAEFTPPWYLKDPATVAAWKFSLTPVSWRAKNAQDLRARAARLAAGTEGFDLSPSGEEGVAIIAALCGLGSIATNMNLPNRGQVEGLPLGAVLETNALVTRDSALPVHAGRLPPAIEGMTARHVGNQETVLRAALSRDARAALPAFLNDPLMTAAPAAVERLFEKMLQNTRGALDWWYKL